MFLNSGATLIAFWLKSIYQRKFRKFYNLNFIVENRNFIIDFKFSLSNSKLLVFVLLFLPLKFDEWLISTPFSSNTQFTQKPLHKSFFCSTSNITIHTWPYIPIPHEIKPQNPPIPPLKHFFEYFRRLWRQYRRRPPFFVMQEPHLQPGTVSA